VRIYLRKLLIFLVIFDFDFRIIALTFINILNFKVVLIFLFCYRTGTFLSFLFFLYYY